MLHPNVGSRFRGNDDRAPKRERPGVTKSSPVIAAKAAIQKSQPREQVATEMGSARSDGGAVLEAGNAPLWIATFAAMTKGVAQQRAGLEKGRA